MQDIDVYVTTGNAEHAAHTLRDFLDFIANVAGCGLFIIMLFCAFALYERITNKK